MLPVSNEGGQGAQRFPRGNVWLQLRQYPTAEQAEARYTKKGGLSTIRHEKCSG